MRTCFLFIAASYANLMITVKLLRLVIVLPILTVHSSLKQTTHYHLESLFGFINRNIIAKQQTV